MRLAKTILGVVAAILMIAAFAAPTRADNLLNKKTIITFSQPVEIPGGKVLPAGTYNFELYETFAYRHIVRIFNQDRSQILATILAIPNYRLTPTEETVMTFSERPGNAPSALKAWFYPGDNYGQEFVYPKERAVQLAEVTHETIPAVETEPATVEEMKSEPIVAETPEKREVTVAEAFPTPPPSARSLAPAAAPAATLPKTASQVPLIGLLGMLSVSLAFAVKRLIG